MTKTAPISESQRIESLDVLRGFALLGILLLNIIGFGFISSAYVAPSLTIQSPADMVAWILVDLTAEGAMRGLFSILFGAGVVLFLGSDSNSRGGLPEVDLAADVWPAKRLFTFMARRHSRDLRRMWIHFIFARNVSESAC